MRQREVRDVVESGKVREALMVRSGRNGTKVEEQRGNGQGFGESSLYLLAERRLAA